jgi:uncharacterized membrane protein
MNEWRVVSLAPWGRLVDGLAIALALAVVLLAWRALAVERRAARRWLLLALRLGAVAAALVLFFQPAVRLENVTRLPNHVAVLVDTSESMRLAEAAGAPSRAERAARLVADSRPAWARLAERHRLDYYTFGDRLAPSTAEALAASGAPGLKRARATRIAEALASLRGRYDAHDLGGVVIISDGADNGRLGQRPLDAESLDFLKALDAPVHTAWVGQPGLEDVSVAQLYADDFAFVRTAIKIEALLRVVGAGPAGWAGRTLPVTLRRDGVPLETVDVHLAADQTDYRVSFGFTPDRVGQYLYEISTPVLEGEAIAENNARPFVLKVIRDKIRVLQVAGRPSWDERFLRGLLKRDPNVDLISFFILRTPTDLELVPSDELSLIPFPTEELFQEQLRSFDVVFLQNFNFAPYGIGAYLGEIRQYVEEGGGLAMIGGDLSFSLGGYAHTPIDDLLPVELVEGQLDPLAQLSGGPTSLEHHVDAAPFRLQLTPDGRAHPLTALKLDLAQNQVRWGELPELDGTNLVARARPGATVLGVHPLVHDQDGRPLPVLSVAEPGKGRTLALTSDSSWHWSFAGDGRTYQKFWDNAIRWLIRDPALSLLRVETNAAARETTDEEAPRVAVDAHAVGPDYQPVRGVEVQLTVLRVGARPQPVASHAGRTDENGDLHVELDPLPAGGYRVSARATIAGRPAEADQVFLVRGAGRELEEPEARPDLLRQIAAATGGSFRGPGESLDGLAFHPPRVVRVNEHHDVELWSGWWVLALAAVCLSANWALRRRWGYA